ncbi:Flp pilus assembly complex ATPase component TadA [Alcaligenaceae bacterium]|nr:Flp pilus assembly complex ATPase component TadA [Alcaligenaceae bacterium]
MRQRISGWLHHAPFVPSYPLRQAQDRYDSAQAGSIANAEELFMMRPSFVELLDEQFAVQALVGRLCPVLLDDGAVALFALAEHVGSDQADELSRRIVQQGYRLANPARYMLTAPLLLAIGRRQLLLSSGLPSGLGVATGGTEHSTTALADAFQDMVEWGVRHQASDLHINLLQTEAVSEVRYTVAGRYVAPECFRGMPTSMLSDMLAVAWMDIRGGNGAVFDPGSEQQGSIVKTVGGQCVMLRWASLAAERGVSVCLRLLVRTAGAMAPELHELGYLPDQIEQIQRALTAEGGAVVFAGTVGSGKSTTLASLISRLPDDRKVITVEDPVEYVIPGAIQNTVARALDKDAHNYYAAKLRALKRSAMSDVLLGEIRDSETGLAFMDLASSGVNIYTTVHAPSAALVAERLASDFIGVSRDFLATPGVLKLLVYQALLPLLCANCALPADGLFKGEKAREWQARLDAITTVYGDISSGLKVRNTEGCSLCRQAQLLPLAGYAGRTVAAEILEPALRPGYLHSVQTRSLPYWLEAEQQQSTGPMAMENSRRCAMDSAMIKASLGQIDPRDIESRFQSFQTLYLRSQLDTSRKSHHLRVIS